MLRQKQCSVHNTLAVLDFILKNRDGKWCYQTFNSDQILVDLLKAQHEDSLFVVKCEHEITGVVVGQRDNERSVLFIRQILLTRKGDLQLMIDTFHKVFPQWTLEGKRRGKVKQFKL